MKKALHRLWSRLTGRNSQHTPPAVIKDQLLEKRPLPMGRAEFHAWSDRIISGALVPGDVSSQRFALANLLMHLGPQESHKEDAFFIHSMRRSVVQQVAHAMMTEIRDEAKARLAEEQAEIERLKRLEDDMQAAADHVDSKMIKYARTSELSEKDFEMRRQRIKELEDAGHYGPTARFVDGKPTGRVSREEYLKNQ